MVQTLRLVAYRLLVPLFAAVIGGFFGFFAFGFGLFMPAVVARPLAYLVTAHFAALGAAWSANLFAPDRSRSRLLRIVATAVAAAVVYSALDLVLLLTVATEGPLAVAVFFVLIFLTVVASIAAWIFREPTRSLARDGLLTFGLVVGAFAFVVASIAGTCSFFPCVP